MNGAILLAELRQLGAGPRLDSNNTVVVDYPARLTPGVMAVARTMKDDLVSALLSEQARLENTKEIQEIANRDGWEILPETDWKIHDDAPLGDELGQPYSQTTATSPREARTAANDDESAQHGQNAPEPPSGPVTGDGQPETDDPAQTVLDAIPGPAASCLAWCRANQIFVFLANDGHRMVFAGDGTDALTPAIMRRINDLAGEILEILKTHPELGGENPLARAAPGELT